jgi:peptidoglycan hydrolase FlgJ
MMIQKAQSQPNLLRSSSAIPSSKASGLKGKEIADEKLKKACGDFEAIFIAKMLKTMRQGIPKSRLLDGGIQEDIYNSLFDEEVSRSLAQKRGLGIGKMLYESIRKPSNQNPTDLLTASTDQRGGGLTSLPREERK